MSRTGGGEAVPRLFPPDQIAELSMPKPDLAEGLPVRARRC